MNITCLFQVKTTNKKKSDHVTGIRGWKKMICSYSYRRNAVSPIEEWLCYVDIFYLLTNKEELDIDELDKNLVELKEWCELYTHPKAAFFELLYKKFTEHRNHPNLKELIFELIRTRDEERLLRKEVLCLDYFSRVKRDGADSGTEQAGTDNTGTGKDDNDTNDNVNMRKQIESNHADLLPKEITGHKMSKSVVQDYNCKQVSKSDSRESISGETDGDTSPGILDTGKASKCHRNRDNVAENEQINDTDHLKFGAENMSSDENPKSGEVAQNAMCKAENDNTIDASVSWINLSKDDTHHEEKTTDKRLGAGQGITKIGNKDKFEDDSEDEDGFVRVEYKDLE